MGRIENAERVVMETFVFVRRARRAGYTNRVTRLALEEIATQLGLRPRDWNIHTAMRLARREAVLMDEQHLLNL